VTSRNKKNIKIFDIIIYTVRTLFINERLKRLEEEYQRMSNGISLLQIRRQRKKLFTLKSGYILLL